MNPKKVVSFTDELFFLSNFYPCDVLYDGVLYPSVEHAYQAAKTLDMQERVKIRNQTTPGQAKREGQRVVLRPGWEMSKVDVMRQLLMIKFVANPKLGKQLLSTSHEELVEVNNWHDNFWGDCQCSKCKKVIGRNMLGLSLRTVRVQLLNLEE